MSGTSLCSSYQVEFSSVTTAELILSGIVTE
jgi:hypothetical protein